MGEQFLMQILNFDGEKFGIALHMLKVFIYAYT